MGRPKEKFASWFFLAIVDILLRHCRWQFLEDSSQCGSETLPMLYPNALGGSLTLPGFCNMMSCYLGNIGSVGHVAFRRKTLLIIQLWEIPVASITLSLNLYAAENGEL